MEFFTFDWVSDPAIWVSLATLAALEIVLGIDNLVFIAILTNRLPEPQRPLARKVGLAMALLSRLALLATIAWIVTLTRPLFSVAGLGLSWRDLILLGGGLFLIMKATREIHHEVEGDGEPEHGVGGRAAMRASFAAIVAQIAVVDIIFSLDSVITAVGMANDLSIMITAMVIAMLVMLASARTVSRFIDQHPSLKILALAFLLLIGVMLVAEGMGTHVNKGYIYFAMAFSLLVELLNMRYRRGRRPARARH